MANGKKFSGKMIFSDVDGTLLHSQTGEIPEENVKAIEYFVEEGGIFTLATGRGYKSAAQYMEKLPINAPCVFLNGGQLYDANKKEVLHKKFLPDHCRELIANMSEQFKHTTLVVVCDDDYYLGTPDRTGGRYVQEGKEKFPRIDITTTSEKISKVLFIIGEEDDQAFRAFAKRLQIEGIRLVFSGSICAEMIPKESTKANGMREVAKMCNIDIENTIAIGDYFNDYEMIEEAGLGASVENGHPDIKALADIVMCSCDQGALSALIDYLEQQIG